MPVGGKHYFSFLIASQVQMKMVSKVLGVMPHAQNSNPWEAEEGGLL